MTIKYEFQINKLLSKKYKLDIFNYIIKLNELNKIQKRKNITLKVQEEENNIKKCTYECSSTKILNKIIKKILKTDDTKIIYIIKKDDINDIIDVLFDIDSSHYNTDIANDLENTILGNIYEKSINI